MPSSPSIFSSASRLWRTSRAGDYLGLLLLAASNIALMVTEPFHRMFTIDDPRLKYPHALIERVSVPYLLVLAVLVPLGTIVAWTGVLQKGRPFLQSSLLGLGNSLLLASFITDFIKQGVGRPRPDLIDRCQPREDTPHNELVTFKVCYQTNHHILHDGFRSFPSGHSSTAFAGLLYLSLFLAGQFFAFRPGADLVRTCAAFSATVLAGYIALSRLEDYRHDYADVSVGSWIGILCAYFSYRRYFHPLRSARCNEPYKLSSEENGYEGVKDEDHDDEEEERGRRGRLSDIEMGMVRS
ncbi:hypothetical protein AOL_s00004g361 [Orbilia oligospora ATCC 24927]|uniref:Phosphatidic acid phosphatase type 2/haloperoxidase domain-containing protein n=2 Tax=Orbilia oligospora TaxID=2813651 RepID=G1WYK1_ARTOA|nr:hypothetical protein AOL_s00004g361 [Orbilia oligospora ATCC 24927]EGX54328.1 hypothetical protein AOL_s00004g361 [Orbilia oligospora ATCC 24927]